MYDLIMNFHDVEETLEHNKWYLALVTFPKEAPLEETNICYHLRVISLVNPHKSEVNKSFSLEQNSGCSCRQAFIHYCGLIRSEGELKNYALYGPYKVQFISSPSDLMKYTVVDESLSTTTTRVCSREKLLIYF